MNRLPNPRHARVVPPNPLRAAVGMLVILALLYAVQFYVQLSGVSLTREHGLVPRQVDGLDGIVWAPLLHSGFPHLFANSLPLFVFGWLVLSGGVRYFAAVTATVWIVAGVGTWLIGSGGQAHIGASSVIFGWFVFLLLRGFLQRHVGQIAVAVLLFLLWGSMLWGVFPGQPNVSWEGHLCGAFGGALAAWLVARSTRNSVEPGGAGTLKK